MCITETELISPLQTLENKKNASNSGILILDLRRTEEDIRQRSVFVHPDVFCPPQMATIGRRG